jgi:exopolyphosphatase/guanosine-5'-triphosphate,3'-diphosphate pyrophosphatase
VSPVAPRWEWRTFGDDLDAATSILETLGEGRAEDSDELYLLSRASDESVKVRSGLLELKLLERRSEDGLELWRPSFEGAFPLGADELDPVLAALGAPVPLALERYSEAELLDEIAAHPGLLAVEVHKHRRHFTLDGCLAESTSVTTHAASTTTIAIESEHSEQVVAARRRLRIDDRANVSYPRGLKTLLRFGGSV